MSAQPIPSPVPTLAELAADPSHVRELTPEQARSLAIALAPLVESLRIQALASTPTPTAVVEPRWVSAAELARLRYPGRNARWIVSQFGGVRAPWVDRRSRKVILFELGGFDRYTTRPRV